VFYCHDSLFFCVACACDGIGGTVNREAAKKSLQATTSGHILTPIKLYNWATQNIVGIHFIYCPSEDIMEHADHLKQSFDSSQTVSGTRDNHCFITVDKYTVRVSRVSGDECSFTANVSYPESQATEMPPTVCFLPGHYVACLYDRDSNARDLLTYDVQVIFLHPHGRTAKFRWPRREDVCWVPKAHVLANVDLCTETGRSYTLDTTVVKLIAQRYQGLIADKRNEGCERNT